MTPWRPSARSTTRPRPSGTAAILRGQATVRRPERAEGGGVRAAAVRSDATPSPDAGGWRATATGAASSRRSLAPRAALGVPIWRRPPPASPRTSPGRRPLGL
ncbi:hypothetical protein D6B98_39045 [Bradyrhizobium sp. LVM 105]|uniref:Uncharacterized protein n=1 Tax=Bradyrhizobium frederickii TaxID=2560054 RepID=A0A4Y9KNN7_9BRAD|nr:hypothetical protein D6B98_39045 [Bradyrhizobium sp. LVM 105]TFV28654.1 hypothetical protein E4K66_38705 [Bradyrhizobium frederickii]TFV67978.1 hypothetical protein E4K64_37885 [Bradyrhizobium frederickii]